MEHFAYSVENLRCSGCGSALMRSFIWGKMVVECNEFTCPYRDQKFTVKDKIILEPYEEGKAGGSTV